MKSIDARIANALGKAGENIEMLTVDSTGKDLYQKAANGDLVRVNDMTEKEVEKIVEKVVEKEITKTVYVDKIVTQTIKTYDPSYLSNVIVGNASSPEGTINNPVGNRVYYDYGETSPAQTYADLISGKPSNRMSSLLQILRGVSNNNHTIIIKRGCSNNNPVTDPDIIVIDNAVGNIWITGNTSATSTSTPSSIFNHYIVPMNSYSGPVIYMKGSANLTLAGGCYNFSNCEHTANNGLVYNEGTGILRISAPTMFLLGYISVGIYGKVGSVSSAGKLYMLRHVKGLPSNQSVTGTTFAFLKNSKLSYVSLQYKMLRTSASSPRWYYHNISNPLLFNLTNSGISELVVQPNTIENNDSTVASVISMLRTLSANNYYYLFEGTNILIEKYSIADFCRSASETNDYILASYKGSGKIYSETAGAMNIGTRTIYTSGVPSSSWVSNKSLVPLS